MLAIFFPLASSSTSLSRDCPTGLKPAEDHIRLLRQGERELIVITERPLSGPTAREIALGDGDPTPAAPPVDTVAAVDLAGRVAIVFGDARRIFKVAREVLVGCHFERFCSSRHGGPRRRRRGPPRGTRAAGGACAGTMHVAYLPFSSAGRRCGPRR
jgi:hypothetical protein